MLDLGPAIHTAIIFSHDVRGGSQSTCKCSLTNIIKHRVSRKWLPRYICHSKKAQETMSFITDVYSILCLAQFRQAYIGSFAVSGTTWFVHRILFEVLDFQYRVLVRLIFCSSHCDVITIAWIWNFWLWQQWILCSWNDIHYNFLCKFLVLTRSSSLLGFFRWQSTRPLPPYFSNVSFINLASCKQNICT